MSPTSRAVFCAILASLVGSSAFAQNKITIKDMPTKQNPSLKPEITISGVHMSETWPVNFKVPKYATNVVNSHFINSVKGAPSAAATLVTTDQPKNVYLWYQDACRKGGWKIALPTESALSKMNKHGEVYFLNARKEKEQAFICFNANKKPPGTLVSISWSLTK